MRGMIGIEKWMRDRWDGSGMLGQGVGMPMCNVS